VIEEAPAPGMDEITRAAICDAAVRAAKAVDYVGAGTIEFIADASEGLRADRIWFMEMNTRLQVEHPVTEEITGQDLVEWQLRVASGEPLPKRQDDLTINGWAIEARLYAEDPAKGFLPSIGRLEIFRPHRAVRLETGVYEGAEISPFYDPMIAKIIAHASDRESACEILARACAETDIFPVKTNAPFLWRALDDPDFRAGRIDTGFIAAKGDALLPPAFPTEDMVKQAAAAILVQEYCGQPTMLSTWEDDLLASEQPNPWRAALGFRLNAHRNLRVSVAVEGKNYHTTLPDDWQYKPIIGEPVLGGVAVNDHGLSFLASLPRTSSGAAGAATDGAILAPMPGRVTSVDTRDGDIVVKGERLLTLEAMKMEHNLTAPFDGVVIEFNVEVGMQVSEGKLLARIEPAG
jgi:3-methylcrotonyl-CoA carboxylase alpha subunit